MANKPVTLTVRAAVSGEITPEPLDVVGGLEGIGLTLTAADITDSTSVGRAVLVAANTAAARTAIATGGVGVNVVAVVPAADGTAVGTAFNLLLTSLKNAGIIASA